jgi:mRNA interferase RelE/StbE
VYEIYLERGAEKDLKKLQAEDFQQVINKVKDLADNPRPSGSRKISGSKNDWRIRVRDLRIIYEIDEKLKIVNAVIQIINNFSGHIFTGNHIFFPQTFLCPLSTGYFSCISTKCPCSS